MVLFNEPGPANTRQTLRAACQRAEELGLREMVVASTTGATALSAHKLCVGMSIVAVTYHAGFREPFGHSMKPRTRNALEAKGVRVVQATHAFSGVERGLAGAIPGAYPLQIVSETLRLFGCGTKVAVEVSIMAADGGMLSGHPIVAVGGTGSGADTALVITPADQSRFMNIRIHEVICKPGLYLPPTDPADPWGMG